MCRQEIKAMALNRVVRGGDQNVVFGDFLTTAGHFVLFGVSYIKVLPLLFSQIKGNAVLQLRSYQLTTPVRLLICTQSSPLHLSGDFRL